MKVEVDVPGSLSLTVPTVCGRKATLNWSDSGDQCVSPGGRPGLHVPNSPYTVSVDLKQQ